MSQTRDSDRPSRKTRAAEPDAARPSDGASPEPIAAGLLAPGVARLEVPDWAPREGHRPPSGAPVVLFLAIVSRRSPSASDIGTKHWAEKHLEASPMIVALAGRTSTSFSRENKGGAWGLLQATSENVRRPFFLLVSVAAIAFIVTLYSRLQPPAAGAQVGSPARARRRARERLRPHPLRCVIDFIDVHVTLGTGVATTTGRRSTSPTSRSASVSGSWRSTCSRRQARARSAPHSDARPRPARAALAAPPAPAHRRAASARPTS